MKPVVLFHGADIRHTDEPETAEQAEAARELGCRIVELPRHFDDVQARALLDAIDAEPVPTWGFWLGYIVPLDVYRAVDEALQAKNIFLVNDTERHQVVFELDGALPYLRELTPRTLMARHVDDAARAAADIGYPVFLKGALQSRKDMGWKACVADNEDELRHIVQQLEKRKDKHRGRVAVREVAPIIRRDVGASNFPVSREFRVFLFDGEVMGFGYYWPYIIDGLYELTDAQQQDMLDVARDAVRRLPTPWVSLDMGQLEDGRWIVIEPGDPQFSGLSFIETKPTWRNLVAAVDRWPPPTAPRAPVTD